MPVIGPTNHASDETIQAAVDACWKDFWVPIIMKNGDVDMEQVKCELYDLRRLSQIVSIVYEDLSGGQMSKPSYNDTGQIIGVIRERFTDEWHEDIARAIVDVELPEVKFDEVDVSGVVPRVAVAAIVEIVLQEIADALGVSSEDLEAAGKAKERHAAWLAKRVDDGEPAPA